MVRALITGYDSAWTKGNRGAIGHCLIEGGTARFVPPVPANFAEALASIEQNANGTDVQIIGIDQPLVVPNQSGGRPVERVVGSLVSKCKGGMQPASRNRESMFGDSAPIWPLLANLNAVLDPMSAIGVTSGRHAFEVYPCVALLGLCPEFMERGSAPKYNPVNRRNFAADDWQRICTLLAQSGSDLQVAGLGEWANAHADKDPLKKHHQDELDAAICVVITMFWWRFGLTKSLMIGDIATGYIVTPTNPAMTQYLYKRADYCGVPAAGPALEVKPSTKLEPTPSKLDRATEVLIRTVTTADADSIATIYNQGIEDRVATLETTLRDAADRAAWMEAKGKRFPVMVAVNEDGTVVGWASLNQFSPRPAYDHVADISVYVERSQRGRGIGDSLLKALEQRARSLGFHKLVLAAFPTNARGLRLYQRCGFITVGVYREQGRLDDQWVDTIVMEKILA